MNANKLASLESQFQRIAVHRERERDAHIMHALLLLTETSGIAVIPPYGSTSTSSSANGPNLGKRDSAVSSYYGKLLTPRISFTDDAIGKYVCEFECQIYAHPRIRNNICILSTPVSLRNIILTVERRVSDTGPSSYYREGQQQQQQQQQHKGGRLSTCSIGSSQPLVKLARLLNQRPSFTPPSDDIPRRLSWERSVSLFFDVYIMLCAMRGNIGRLGRGQFCHSYLILYTLEGSIYHIYFQVANYAFDNMSLYIYGAWCMVISFLLSNRERGESCAVYITTWVIYIFSTVLHTFVFYIEETLRPISGIYRR